MGRFINADGLVSTGQGLLSNNMFVYCGNNPVNRADQSGQFWETVGNFFNNIWSGITSWFSSTFGAGASTTSTIYKEETPVIPDPFPITITETSEISLKDIDIGDSTKPISVYANGNLNKPIASTAGVKINVDQLSLQVCVGIDDISVKGLLRDDNSSNSFGARLDLSRLKLGIEYSSSVTWDLTTHTDSVNASINGWTLVFLYYLATTGQGVPSPVTNS